MDDNKVITERMMIAAVGADMCCEDDTKEVEQLHNLLNQYQTDDEQKTE